MYLKYTRIGLIVTYLLICVNCLGQATSWNIEVRGIITQGSNPLSGSKVLVYSDSTLLRSTVCIDGTFDLFLQPDTNYTLAFSKKDYVTEYVFFTTKNVPAGRAQDGFSPYDIVIALPHKVANAEIEQAVNAPLAVIRYSAGFNQGDFINDEQYAMHIKPFLKILNYEVKQAENRVNEAKQVMLDDLQLKKQRIIIYSIIVILLLTAIFGFILYKNFKIKQKLFGELGEKNRAIGDSINYAKRIQAAMLPRQDEIHKIFPDSFILYLPKDIVSGDFYFFLNNEQGILIGAADCTGHGVPGAFLSCVGCEQLHEASKGTTHPGKVLSQINNGIRSSLNQSLDSNNVRDGMDIALCSITVSPNLSKGGASEIPLSGGLRGAASVTLQFSGANRPLWIIRDNGKGIEEIKPTKKAIAGFTEEGQQFDTMETIMQKGDTFYMFSDGYADQFGGTKGKKLTTKGFKEVLLGINKLGMAEQVTYLEHFIETWMGKEEQIDDILVVGIRV